MTNSKNFVSLFFIVLFGALFWGALEYVDQKYFFYDDNINFFISSLKYIWVSLFEHHQIPTYNFYQHGGEKFIGQSLTGFFNPFAYLSSALSFLFVQNISWSFEILMLFYIIATGVFMYLVLRFFHVRHLLCVLGALLWMTSPFFILVSKSWFPVANTIPFLPLVLLSLLHLIKNPSYKTLLFSSASKALVFFTGHPQFVFILFLSELIFLSLYVGIPFFKALSVRKNERSHEITASLEKYKKVLCFSFLSYAQFLIFSAPKLLTVLDSTLSSSARSTHLSKDVILELSLDILPFF